MRFNYRLCVTIIAAAGFAGFSGGGARAQAQDTGLPLPPPGGYSWETVGQVPSVQPRRGSGPAGPGLSTLPGGTFPSAYGTGQLPRANQPGSPATGLPTPPWSPGATVWDIQDRIGRSAAGANYGRVPSYQGAGQRDRSADIPRDPSGLGSGRAQGQQWLLGDRAEQRQPDAVDEAARGTRPGGIGAPRGTENPLDNIPFDQFQTLEDFQQWLERQMDLPDVGDPRRALAPDARQFGTDAPEARTRDAGGQWGPQAGGQQVPAWQERPPIGYLGIGSTAMSAGSIQMGGTVAQDSAQLAAELNQYFRQARPRPRPMAVPSTAYGGPPRRTAPHAHNDWVRQVTGGGFSVSPYQLAPEVQNFAPQVQPQPLWQDPGGNSLPMRPNDWFPPSAGY